MTNFTLAYVQPADYRFSLDSVQLAAWVANWVEKQTQKPSIILDLCAGCGVVGLEYAFHRGEPLAVDFVEIQSVYRPFFEENVRRLGMSDRTRGRQRSLTLLWKENNYVDLTTPANRESYDLILCNPPYFLPEQGHHSPQEFKNRCRFFLDATSGQLWDVIGNCLKPAASAFVLVRPLDDHQHDLLAELRQRSRYWADVQIVADIRGTHLLQIRKVE